MRAVEAWEERARVMAPLLDAFLGGEEALAYPDLDTMARLDLVFRTETRVQLVFLGTCTPAHLLLCSPAHLLLCTSTNLLPYTPAPLHTCTPAPLHTSSSAPLHTCSSAPQVHLYTVTLGTGDSRGHCRVEFR